MTIPLVELRVFAPVQTAVLRQQVRASELSRVVPDFCGRVWKTLRAQGIQGGRNVAVYLDGAIHLEAGVEVSGQFAEQDGGVRSATPSGRRAVFTHYGPYGELGSAHAGVREWAKKTGHKLTGPNWEVYGHWQEAWNGDPSLIRTDVCYSVA